jgi:hypothetical protein
MREPCRQCGGTMQDGTCLDCGASKNKKVNTSSHRCDYEDCPLTGTITDTTMPSMNTKWYCSYHHDWWDSPAAAQESLIGIKSGRLTGNKRSWKDQALHDKGVELKKSDPIIFAKGTSKEIAEVNLVLIRSLKSRDISLPYDKQKRLTRGEGYAEDKVLAGYKAVKVEA